VPNEEGDELNSFGQKRKSAKATKILIAAAKHEGADDIS